MPSITRMISVMRCDDFEISSIVLTASLTTWPPRAATALASSARRVACSAVSSVWRTLDASSVSAEEVSSSEAADVSVRCDRSRLPMSISRVAALIECTPLRTSRMTWVIFSTNALNEAEICATSSWPTTARRCVMSPSPEPMVSMASRTADRRLNARDVITLAMVTAISVRTTSEIRVACSTCVRPTVASALSSATTRYQSVPGTRRAFSSFCAPSSMMLAGAAPSRARDATTSAVSAGEMSVDGLSASLSFRCEIT